MRERNWEDKKRIERGDIKKTARETKNKEDEEARTLFVARTQNGDCVGDGAANGVA